MLFVEQWSVCPFISNDQSVSPLNASGSEVHVPSPGGVEKLLVLRCGPRRVTHTKSMSPSKGETHGTEVPG